MFERQNSAASVSQQPGTASATRKELNNLNIGLGALSDTFLFAPMRTRLPEKLPGARGWCLSIRHMLAAGYAFNSMAYDNTGCLFRAYGAGFRHLVNDSTKAQVLNSQSGKHSALFEQVFNVQFLTHELSDAVTACGHYSDTSAVDRAIVVLRSRRFNEANQRGTAASLSIGDSGQVFQYPFLADAISADDILFAFVDHRQLGAFRNRDSSLKDRLIGLPEGDRARGEQHIKMMLDRHGLLPATVRNGAFKPLKNDAVNQAVAFDLHGA